jgi:hypothetical protein
VWKLSDKANGGKGKVNFRGLLGVFSVVFSQSYIEHDLRKNKIVVSFFANRLIFMS